MTLQTLTPAPGYLKFTDVTVLCPDHTASCVIVDLDLPDCPLIWASESFCQMSGYALEDIRGRNLRFMQAPGGEVLSSNSSSAFYEPIERASPTMGSKPKSPRHPTSSPKSRPGASAAASASSAGSSSSTETIDATPTPIPPKPTRKYIPPPDSHVRPGSARIHTDQATVDKMRTKLSANEEVQVTVLNYRRDSTPFWNWLSIIPVREAGEGSRFR